MCAISLNRILFRKTGGGGERERKGYSSPGNWHYRRRQRVFQHVPENGEASGVELMLELAELKAELGEMTRRRPRKEARIARDRASASLISMQNVGLARGARVVPPCVLHLPEPGNRRPETTLCACTTAILAAEANSSPRFTYASLCAGRIADARNGHYRTPSTRVARFAPRVIPHVA